MKHYQVKDVPLTDFDFAAIKSFELMCQTEWGCFHASTVNKHIQRLHTFIKSALNNDWLEKNPFRNYKAKKVITKIKYLTAEELQSIEEKFFSIDRLQKVRDVFLFSCYTGYAYVDLQKFTPSDVISGIDGMKWIFTERFKTSTQSYVPLLPAALNIIERYKNDPQTVSKGKSLPVLANQKTNSYLKEIADLCGIRKQLTLHMARHTFATTVTLTNGVPIESVSKMMGHSSLKTTQIYAKVLENKISSDMLILKEKLEPKSKTPLQLIS